MLSDLSESCGCHFLAGAGFAASSTGLVDTLTTYLSVGHSLEATARELFVHANTVRYRLGRTHDLTGYDLTCPEDAFAIRLGLMYADLDAARSRPRTRPGASRAAREQPSQV